MSHQTASAFTALFLLVVFTTTAMAKVSINTDYLQTEISGTVVSASDNEPLSGVNVTVKGKVIGTTTNAAGEFGLTTSQELPLTLVFSMVGFQTQEREITSGNQNSLQISMQEQTIIGSDVVVSASRVEESILEAPVSIEKMDILNIRNTPSEDYYKALSNLKAWI